MMCLWSQQKIRSPTVGITQRQKDWGMGDKVGKLAPMKFNLSVSKLNMTGSSSSHRESSLTAMSARNGPKLTPSLRDQSLIQLAFLCFVDCLEDTAAEMTEIKDSA